MTQANDWPLVFFTLFSQISVGILISALVVWLSLKNTEATAYDTMKKVLLLTALALMAVALVLSFLHLSRPGQAIYALSHAANSWLSREIILASLFLLSLALSYASLKWNFPHHKLFEQLYLAATIMGILLIWIMARVYMLPTIPLWNAPSTPVAFFTTTLLLGAMTILVVTALGARQGSQPASIEQVQGLLFYLVAFAVFIALLNMFVLQPDITGLTSSFPLPEVAGKWKNAQIVFLLAGFSLLTWWFAFQHPQEGGTTSWLIYLSAACLFLSELAGRYLFYASYFRVGI